MSIKVMTAVWEYAEVESSGELLVLLALADFANDRGVAWPSVSRLAKKSRLSRRQVFNILAALEERGLLQVDHGTGYKGGNVYLVKILHQSGGVVKSAAPLVKSVNCLVKPTSPKPSYRTVISTEPSCGSGHTQFLEERYKRSKT